MTKESWLAANTLTPEKIVLARRVVDDVRRGRNLGDSLRLAFGEMLQWNAGWIAVLDRGDRFLGVLTPSTLHTALRRSVEAEAKRVDPQAVELESVLDA